ncbi:MAG: hypothetical protein K1X57_17705 [Gemmataceae bacterium]|nr:hypothetical protein [Gemmataceae bacterium]
MIDAATNDRLRQLLRRESRSLYQYLREVPAWTSFKDTNTLARLRECANAELEVVEKLSRWLQKYVSGALVHGAFPDFTPYNDTGLNFLLPLVIREQKQAVRELETDAKALQGEPAEYVNELLALKRAHLATLEDLRPGRSTITTAVV